MPIATLCPNCSSVLAREDRDRPTKVPSVNSSLSHPDSVNSPFSTISRSNPELHRKSPSPERSIEAPSRLQSSHSEGGSGVVPVNTNPPSHEKNHCPDFACSSQTNNLSFG